MWPIFWTWRLCCSWNVLHPEGGHIAGDCINLKWQLFLELAWIHFPAFIFLVIVNLIKRTRDSVSPHRLRGFNGYLSCHFFVIDTQRLAPSILLILIFCQKKLNILWLLHASYGRFWRHGLFALAFLSSSKCVLSPVFFMSCWFAFTNCKVWYNDSSPVSCSLK